MKRHFYTLTPMRYQHGILIKIEGGTVNSSGNLCLTCKHAHNIKFRDGNEETHCAKLDWGGEPLTQPVAECNKYMHANHPTINQMEEIAWKLVTDKTGRDIGFTSPEKLKKLREQGRVDNEEDY